MTFRVYLKLRRKIINVLKKLFTCIYLIIDRVNVIDKSSLTFYGVKCCTSPTNLPESFVGWSSVNIFSWTCMYEVSIWLTTLHKCVNIFTEIPLSVWVNYLTATIINILIINNLDLTVFFLIKVLDVYRLFKIVCVCDSWGGVLNECLIQKVRFCL